MGGEDGGGESGGSEGGGDGGAAGDGGKEGGCEGGGAWHASEFLHMLLDLHESGNGQSKWLDCWDALHGRWCCCAQVSEHALKTSACATDVGMVPLSWFRWMTSSARPGWPSSAGIVPLMRLSATKRPPSDWSALSCTGSVPLMLFRGTNRYWRLAFKRPSCVGSVPASPLSSSSTFVTSSVPEASHVTPCHVQMLLLGFNQFEESVHDSPYVAL